MKGYLVLNGGEAFTTPARPLDSAWLGLIRRAHARHRRGHHPGGGTCPARAAKPTG